MTIQEHYRKVFEDDKYAEKVGNTIANTLFLKPKYSHFYTYRGRKTFIGLARTVLLATVGDYINENEIHPS